MPIKKKTTKTTRKTVSKKIDFKALKKDLLDDLDQFLLEETDISRQQRQTEKQKALAELDRLIKQDLSERELLYRLQEIKNNKKEDLLKKENIQNIDVVNHSHYVLDLRQSREDKKPTRTKLKTYKNSWTKLKEKFDQPKVTEKREFHYPQEEKKFFDFNGTLSLAVKPLKLQSIGSRVIVFALVMGVILMPIRGLFWLGQIQSDKDEILNFGKQGIINLQTGVISASENSYQNAQADFEKALEQFNQAQDVLDEYHQWMLKTASLMPVIGKPISLSQNMLAIATNISEAAAVLNQKLQKEQTLTENLVFINQQIEKTLPYLTKAQKDLNGISASALPNDLRPYFNGLKDYLPSTLDNLHSVHEIFTILEEVLGHDTEKRYIVLFQNNNELRATGGFIGSFALFDVYQGEIVNLEIPQGGMYDLEAGLTVKYQAPQALSLINSHFNIWDANWWPDFPTSAEKITSLYEQSGGSSVDGLIAINADVLKKLLEILGPITMDDYGVTITANNLFSVIQEEVEFNYDKEANTPKAIIADLVPRVLEKLLSFKENQKEVVTAFAKILSTKDIQIYLHDDNLQKKIDGFGWSGRMYATDRDYLNIISTNIAGGKTDNDLYQTIDHQAEIQPNGEIINTLRITRTNKGQEDNPLAGIEGGNVSYLRIYVPLNSQFIEAVGFDKIPNAYFHPADDNAQIDPDIAQEENKMIDNVSNTEIYNSLGKTVFANWTALKPGETKTVSVKYKLPFNLNLGDPLVNNWWQKLFQSNWRLDNYSLLVQSQSGSKRTIFNSSILLSDNIKVVWNNASEKEKMSITDDLVAYSQDLIYDQYFGFIVATK
ncbi:MAG: hypothetical protein COV55_04345 [Candidatus Komeilibacteria bacterium CG11_big_fil_rev_8_21_14_0_20_36_20]|uniref:DUF4012 domain-containing protein n=2 Tax=Patescibacteria group TaxID=1783273 RepID=A0A2H0NBR9_9BACT|nr:MAG: hypothetical protein COV55_04345 [Candidatus Komeilibacteria bacterium CG11_big_fil_rev_8_21_14_0_20_36_20]PIR81473.1 MAG: hypothetical protein COU21_03575 [Candidatus Komeilibacteria bacterium CG10_big_fil_rev_8_21_14_0_10_36_65]PIZ65668.1 MAG: hypothetical protein COY14_01855 [Candidatus Roizmanbacteria bacterium CG_4_10_14_0_2_um_filter_36_9]PJC55674.1 MAG: hypothetical protein CO027_00930 [Candidatus Komeilibacteria bacterium CG_4_9_14_0_2_um_filter_36_13]